jgi:ATP-dependent exoDNAse (exonuclease V) alpha subunit
MEAKIIGREKRGRSVVAAAAYRAGKKLFGEREGKTHDYSRRTKGVIATVILHPEGTPDWSGDPARLWNTVEAGEKRADAQLAREFILAMPKELNGHEQFQLAVAWAQKELVASGMVAEISLHHPKDGKNPHAHILCTMRKLDGESFSLKKPREWNDKAHLAGWRESWADAVNEALEKAGRTERVDHRSLKDRGIDRIPEPKIGVAATAMKRRGILPDPDRFRLVRWIKSLNEVRPLMRAVENYGNAPAETHDKSWLDKATAFMSKARKVARETVIDTWNMLLNSRPSKGHDLDVPVQPERGPDRSR